MGQNADFLSGFLLEIFHLMLFPLFNGCLLSVYWGLDPGDAMVHIQIKLDPSFVELTV